MRFPVRSKRSSEPARLTLEAAVALAGVVRKNSTDVTGLDRWVKSTERSEE